MSDSSDRAVSIRIGVSAFGESRRMARQTVTPSSPGSIDVEHDEIEGPVLRQAERVIAIAGLDARQPFQRQVKRHQLADVRLVLDDEGAARR